MTGLPLRQHVRQLPTIETGAAINAELARRGIVDVVLLNSNEGPFPPFPEALEAIERAARDLNRYPDPTAGPLASDLAALYGVTPEHVVISAGSTNLIFLIAAALLEPDDELVYPWPSFPQYQNAALHQRARPVPVPLRDFTVDTDALLDAITPRTRMVLVANPNNPTGTVADRPALDRFVESLPAGVVAVVDEAYAEFAGDFADGLVYVKAGRPVIVLRTFSKVYGLAGARVGYGVGPPDLIAGLRRLQLPFAINYLGLVAARASLTRQDLVAERARQNELGREQLCAGFRRLGLTWVPSSANFVLVDVGRDGVGVFKGLIQDGIVVRPGRGYTYPNHLRVTVGLPEENTRFLEALERILSS